MTPEVLRMEIAKLELGPNDTLVIKSATPISGAQVEDLRDRAKAILGHERIMVISGIDLSVISETE